MPDGLPITRLVLLLMAMLICLEFIVYNFFRRKSYPWREAATSTFFAVPFLLPAIVLTFSGPATPLHFATADLDIECSLYQLVVSWQIQRIAVDSWMMVVLLFILVDLMHYCYHRAAHRCHWLWASHSVHHTFEHLRLINAIRIGLTELVLGGWLFFVPLIVVGFDPLTVTEFHMINLLIQFVGHVEFRRRLGPVEWLFNTPAHHVFHHALNAEYIDRNFGGTLIIWDRLFGSFVRQTPGVNIRLGLAGDQFVSRHPLVIEAQPFVTLFRSVRAARTWRERGIALFGPPEFSQRLLARADREASPERPSIATASV